MQNDFKAFAKLNYGKTHSEIKGTYRKDFKKLTPNETSMKDARSVHRKLKRDSVKEGKQNPLIPFIAVYD